METKTASAITPPKKTALKNNPWLYIGLLLVLSIIVFSKFLFSDQMLVSSDQVTGLDARVFMRSSITEHGQFPMWFSPRLGGMPTIDAMFGDAFYPPSVILQSLFPIHRALGLKMFLHVLLAGIFFFLLLYRGFKTPLLLAFIGGAFYMLNPQFLSHVYPGHDGKMYVIAWLPFLIWRMKRLMEAPGLLNSTLLTLGIAFCLFTSHIQMTYFTLWGLFLYWLVYSVYQFRTQKSITPAIKPTLWFGVAVALAIGCALIQVLPSFMYVRDAFSVRGVDKGFEYAASWSMHWPEIFSTWVPEFCGVNLDRVNTYWSENAFKLNSDYAGAMALLFAALAIALKPSVWRIFWGAIGLFAALYSLGAHTPVFHIAYALIPGVKKFRACSMMMFWFSFSTILLCSLALKDLAGGYLASFDEKRKKRWQTGLYVALGAITLSALLFTMQGFTAGIMQLFTTAISETQKSQIFEANFAKNFVPALWLWWAFAAAALGMVIALLNGKIKPTTLLIAILLIGLIDIMRVDLQFVKTTSPLPYFYNDQAILDLQQKMKQEPFRCFALPGSLPQNGEGIHKLEGISGFHDNELHWYRLFRGSQQDNNFFDKIVGVSPEGQAYLIPQNMEQGNPFLNLANMRYYLYRQGNDLLALENKGALGRVSFARSYIVMDTSQVAAALRNGTYDYTQTVALVNEPTVKPAITALPDSVPLPAMTTVWNKYTPNYRSATITAPADGFLRISEVYYPGWKFTVDGKDVPFYQADLSWMAITITKGVHTIVMKPHSNYIGKALWISIPCLAGLIVYLGGIVLLLLFKKKPKKK